MSWSLSWLRRFCLNALMSSIAITVINASVLTALATESVAQSVPPDKYGDRCKAIADDPAAALAEYIAQAEKRMPKKSDLVR